jgi:putative peptidoglycan binding protein/CHAP domain-containing protein
MAEWDFDREIAGGSPARRVRLVQEWLCLQGLRVKVDGEYGPATSEAVRQFQQGRTLRATGKVNRTTFDSLLGPLRRALTPIEARGRGLGEMVVVYARQHLLEQPREVGGQNCGPWVRLYMKGREGDEWPWCAGFVCFVLRQAADSAAVALPVRPSFSCDSLAASAREKGRFLPGAKAREDARLKPGALFLTRRTATDWGHVGIVLSTAAETLTTIEGNTNDAGEREGYEVCQRIRGYEDKDFISVD